MPYVPISRPHGLPKSLDRIVDQQVDLFLRDVHSMLMLPINPVPGLEGGCNFAAALTLFEVIGGVSQELWLDPDPKLQAQRHKRSGPRFMRVLEDHFPWSQEPKTGEELVGQDAAECLYKAYRNALTHNLGVVQHSDYVGDIKILKGPLSDEEIVLIEQSADRPDEWTQPTLRLTRSDGGKEVRRLTVKCFYWGTRKMIENVLADRAKQPQQPEQNSAPIEMSISASTPNAGPPTTTVSSGSIENWSETELAELDKTWAANDRPHAGYFSWETDPTAAELGVLSEFASALSSDGECFFINACHRGLGNDPPDCEAHTRDGRPVGIEITELVDPKSAAAARAEKPYDWKDWNTCLITELEGILKRKDNPTQVKGGPYVEYVLIMHTDEPWLEIDNIRRSLAEHVFPATSLITRAYLLISYCPWEQGCPCIELNIENRNRIAKV